MLSDADTDAESVSTLADELLSDPGRLDSMAAAAGRLGRPDAAEALARVVREAAR
jgi:UDP-N-acetylglucosamine:LPS N-acetylglucosamine transferase